MTSGTSSRKESRTLAPRRAGLVGVAGGLLWLVALMVEYAFDLFPPGTGPAFVANQLMFILAMVCYVVAITGLLTSGAAGSGRAARLVVGAWAAGWLIVLVGALWALLVPESVLAEVLPAVGGLLTAVSALATGVMVVRAARWSGWQRWAPLALALYVILALFLPLFLGAEPNLFTEGGWALAYVMLGAALYTQ